MMNREVKTALIRHSYGSYPSWDSTNTLALEVIRLHKEFERLTDHPLLKNLVGYSGVGGAIWLINTKHAEIEELRQEIYSLEETAWYNSFDDPEDI